MLLVHYRLLLENVNTLGLPYVLMVFLMDIVFAI